MKNETLKAIIFDLDGTLVDTSEGVVASAAHAIEALGLEALSHDELLQFIGPPLQDSFVRLCGCCSDEVPSAIEAFRACYRGGAMFKARPYDGVRELCEQLTSKGLKLAVATSKLEKYAVEILRHFGLASYFDCICGADEDGALSKADNIKRCVACLGCEPTKCVMVGDTEYDAAGAATAGVRFIAVTYGFGFRNRDDVAECACVGVASTSLEVLEVLAEG